MKGRFARLAGTGKERQRQVAFTKAAEVARENTLRNAPDRQQVETIFEMLDENLDRSAAEALTEETAKLMLFSAAPDVPRLTNLCRRIIGFEAVLAGEPAPPPEAIADVLSDFLTNLREAMLDQPAYYDLVQREMLRTLRKIAAPPWTTTPKPLIAHNWRP